MKIILSTEEDMLAYLVYVAETKGTIVLTGSDAEEYMQAVSVHTQSPPKKITRITPKYHHGRWSDEEEAILKDHIDSNVPVSVTQRTLGRELISITSKARSTFNVLYRKDKWRKRGELL